MMEPGTLFFLAVLALVYMLTLFTIPAYLIKRAMATVIRIFHAHGATEAQRAKSLEELGLKQPAFFDRIGKMRDYKPTALKFLMRAGVIKETLDQRVYLSEKGMRRICEQDEHNRLGLCKLVIEKNTQNLPTG